MFFATPKILPRPFIVAPPLSSIPYFKLLRHLKENTPFFVAIGITP
jgi:hypothetical protein